MAALVQYPSQYVTLSIDAGALQQQDSLNSNITCVTHRRGRGRPRKNLTTHSNIKTGQVTRPRGRPRKHVGNHNVTINVDSLSQSELVNVQVQQGTGSFVKDRCSTITYTRKRGRPRKKLNNSTNVHVLPPGCTNSGPSSLHVPLPESTNCGSSLHEPLPECTNRGPSLRLLFVPRKRRSKRIYTCVPLDDRTQTTTSSLEIATSPEDASSCNLDSSDSWIFQPLSAFVIPGPIPDFGEISDDELVYLLRDICWKGDSLTN